MENNIVKLTVTIPSGGTTSDIAVFPETFYLSAVLVPIMTTSTVLNFTVSVDNFITSGVLKDKDNSNIIVTFDPASAAYYKVRPTDFDCWKYMKVSVADVQAADRTIELILRQY